MSSDPCNGHGVVEGEGWDHVARRVERPDGAWIVKQVKDSPWDEAVASVAREAAVMRYVRESLPPPFDQWVAGDVSAAGDRLTYRRVPGEPLLALLATGRVPVPPRDRLAAELGRLVAAIASLDPASVGVEVPVDDGGWEGWFDGWDDHVAAIEPLVDAEVMAAIGRFAAAPRPAVPAADRLVLAHNDLGAEHVLVDPASLTIAGIIDWTDAALADPAAEVGRLWRDLGDDAVPIVLDGMGVGGPDRAAIVERARCYARLLAVEDLAYATTHRRHLVPVERATLIRLFTEVRTDREGG